MSSRPEDARGPRIYSAYGLAAYEKDYSALLYRIQSDPIEPNLVATRRKVPHVTARYGTAKAVSNVSIERVQDFKHMMVCAYDCCIICPYWIVHGGIFASMYRKPSS